MDDVDSINDNTEISSDLIRGQVADCSWQWDYLDKIQPPSWPKGSKIMRKSYTFYLIRPKKASLGGGNFYSGKVC